MASMQLMLEFGHDTDSYAQVMGAILGAIHGKDAFPKEIIKTVSKRMKDPYITKLFEKHRAEFKSWSSPSISSQMWVGTIDKKIEKGMHKILVKTIDECKIFEVK